MHNRSMAWQRQQAADQLAWQKQQAGDQLSWQKQQAADQLAWQQKQAADSLAWQERSAAERLRFDLYSRRYAVYTKTLALYHALGALRSEQTDAFLATMRDFIGAMKEANFLFARDSGIAELLDQLHQEAFKIMAHRKAPVGSALRESVTTDAVQADVQFNAILNKLIVVMSPYLDFTKIGA